MDEPSPETIPTAAKPEESKKRDIWIIAGVVILIGIIGLFVIRSLYKPSPIPIIAREETPTPTPTPVRILSAIATQSAFIALEKTYASFSASLTATNVEDPSLSPPNIDLPLGFAQ